MCILLCDTVPIFLLNIVHSVLLNYHCNSIHMKILTLNDIYNVGNYIVLSTFFLTNFILSVVILLLYMVKSMEPYCLSFNIPYQLCDLGKVT